MGLPARLAALAATAASAASALSTLGGPPPQGPQPPALGVSGVSGFSGVSGVSGVSGGAATAARTVAAAHLGRQGAAAPIPQAAIDPAVPMPHPTKAAKREAPRFYECIQEKRQRAFISCGGRCDIAWVGDSLSEDMTGRHCYWDKELPTGGPWSSSPLKKRTVVIAGAMDQTQHTLYTLREVLPSLHRPRVFFVLIGTNNIGTALMSPAKTFTGVRAVVDSIRTAFPGVKVLLHTQLPRYDESERDKGVLQTRLDVLDRLVVDNFAREAPMVQMVNCSGAFARGPALRETMPDFLHPSAEGYRRWLHCLEPVLEEAVRAAP